MKEIIQHKISTFLQKEVPQLQAIYIFGSIADGNIRSESDVDIAILSASKLTKTSVFKLQSKLELALNKDVDLVDLKESSEVFQAQIISTGKRIYTDANLLMEVELFEDRVFQAYIYLKENIQPILKGIKSTGQIYN